MLFQRVEKQGVTTLTWVVAFISLIPIVFASYYLISALASTLGIHLDGRIFGILLAFSSLTVSSILFSPVFRLSESLARNRLVKEMTHDKFKTPKELAAEIKRLQMQRGK